MEPGHEHDAYVKAWRARAREREALAKDEQTQALARANELATLLADQFGATKVILFGSRARGDARLGSDIDLAAEGIPPEVFFAAGAALERAAKGFSVDLVPLESATPYLLECIDREGRLLRGSK